MINDEIHNDALLLLKVLLIFHGQGSLLRDDPEDKNTYEEVNLFKGTCLSLFICQIVK